MRAARFVGVGQPLEIVSLQDPVPGLGEALVRVRAVGLCGSDVHIMEGHTPTAFTPITLGHEISGVLEVLGPDTSAPAAPGDHVFVNPLVGCGTCRQCRQGNFNFCPQRCGMGILRDGGLADFLISPARNLVAVPKSLGFPEVALIESAGTANQAIRVLEVGKGDAIVVIGTGGLGMQAVRIARAHGVEVYAIDTDPVARKRSVDAGVATAFDPGEADLVAKLRTIAGRPYGFDGVVDCVGLPASFSTALDLLRPNGHCAIIGIGAVPLTLTPPAHFMRRALRVSGIYGYSQEDIRQVAAMLIDGSLDLKASVSAVLPLERVNEGLQLFADRKSSPVRVVIEP